MPVNKDDINGVDVVYGLSWSSKKTGKCNVDIITPQGKLYGNAPVEFDGCVSLAAYVSQEISDGVFLWETKKAGNWVIIGIAGGILAPGSDALVSDDDLINAVESMQSFVESDKVFVIGDGEPHLSFEVYDASNIEIGPRLFSKKFDIKIILVTVFIIVGFGVNYGYGLYKDNQEEIKTQELQAQSAAAEIKRKKELEKSIISLSSFDTPLNNIGIIYGINKIQTFYDGWSLKTYSYPSSIGLYNKSKYSYLNNLVNRFGDRVSWNKDGTKAIIQFDDLRPKVKHNFSNMNYMHASVGHVYDISLLQSINNLGYKTSFSDKPPEWASRMPSYPEKYNIMFLRISSDISKLKSLLDLFYKFGYVIGNISINNENGIFVLEIAHYMLSN